MTQPARQVEPPLTPRDIAALTGLDYNTVLAEIASGALPAKKIRGHYFITPASYAAWLNPEVTPVRVRAVRARAGAAGSVESLRALEGGAS